MFSDIDIRELAEMTESERVFLSGYLSKPQAVKNLEKRFSQLRRVLNSSDAEKNEREHFDENVEAVRKYLQLLQPFL